MSFLELHGLSKRYGTVAALDGVGLSVEAGGRTAVVGPSGSGKSTLLRLVAGFEAPDAGGIVLDGDLLADGDRVVPAHRRSIGMVSQDGALFPHLSIAENVGFGLDRRVPGREGRIRELLGLVDLPASMGERRPHELSGGQQQRVALARALARSPKLMLLDEPFSALDTGLREATRRMVAEVLQASGVASLLVTHDQAEALSFADQVAILRDGRLVQAGSPHEVYFAPRDAPTATFMGDALILPAIVEAGVARCALGRVLIEGAAPEGQASVMLRPEQVIVVPVDTDPGCRGRRARVAGVEFAGPLSSVRLHLIDIEGAASGTEIRLKLRSVSVPRPGEIVSLRIDGPGRLLAGAPPA